MRSCWRRQILRFSLMIVHSAIDRAAPRSMGMMRWDPMRLSASKIASWGRWRGCRAMSHVFSRPDEGHEADLGLNPPQGYVDALGEPINPARFDNGIIISISEEVWGIEAARVTQARRFVSLRLNIGKHV
ncbi:hypothetical protein BGW80DRAFT_442981 [Lactifluus volemus]|nr:hypothetical protein BGW80DRAFT_442981 [Lactifluus volemus]